MEFPNSQGSGPGAESDLGELAALFAAHGGGHLSAEVSADLALEIVLNEIVEQACLATGATGAAIVLVRDGEMVCRASSGANAPELGAPLDSETGLTAECIKTRQAQRCDDAQTDPRVDAEASRNLGVQSVMIFPLLRNGEMTGVLEVFSSRPGAFGDRDELTLEALAHRVVKNLDRASDTASMATGTVTSLPAASMVPQELLADAHAPAAVAGVKEFRTDSNSGPGEMEKEELKEHRDVFTETAEQSPGTGFDIVTIALVAAVVACAVLLGTLVGVRMGWRRAAGVRVTGSPGTGVNSRSAANSSATQGAAASNNSTQASGEPAATVPSVSVSDGVGNTKSTDGGKRNTATPSAPPVGAKESLPPAGSLLVYENGKEVFRMLPAAEGATAKTSRNAPADAAGTVQRVSTLEPAGIVELPPDAANGSLLHRVEPEYPEEARQQRIQGAVVLEVRIGRDGAIQDVRLVSGQPLLADAAIAAVKQWRFKPRVLKGQPVEMQTRVTLNFRMPA
jgi:TonB family protein